MPVIETCPTKRNYPEPEDRVCPKCGKTVEVFVSGGKITEDVTCDCGYVFHKE